MTAKEMIERLSKYDPQTRVFIEICDEQLYLEITDMGISAPVNMPDGYYNEGVDDGLGEILVLE